MKTLGFLGKPNITENEEKKLIELGKMIAQSGRELVIVPAKGSASAVEMGMKAGQGKVRRIESGVLSQSAQSLVYADKRLLTRLHQTYPAIATMRNVYLMSSEIELDMAINRLSNILKASGIVRPK